MARKYAAIWQQIKKKNECSIIIKFPREKATIKKGVIKEKDADVAFKVANEDDSFRLSVEYDENTGVMKFKLKQKIGLEEKVV